MTFARVHTTHYAPACPQAVALALLRRHISTGEHHWAERASRARELTITQPQRTL